MSSTQLVFTTEIAAPPATIFHLVADLPNYGQWLPDSSAFRGTVDVTPYPEQLGTTYLEIGPVQKPGEVTEFDPPNHIAFHHIVQVRQFLLHLDIDARIRYTLEVIQSSTFVNRSLLLTFDLPGFTSWATPVVLYGFRKENHRTLAALKRYAEDPINNPQQVIHS